MEYTTNQMDIFLDRYARKNEQGQPIETHPDQMFDRVALAISNTENERKAFADVLKRQALVPGGRILSGAGAETGKTFYNCYVIPIETSARRYNRGVLKKHDQREDHGNDSREAIFDTIGTMVGIMSRGGGVGINWSTLRPRGAYLQRVSGTTSGPVSWMHVASTAVGVVEQGGTRRGAAMFMLDDWHPDIEEFIDAKRDNTRITNANVSVAVSDEFMEAVRRGDDWTLSFPDTTDPAYDTDWDGDLASWRRRGRGVLAYRTLPARTLWKRITDAAHASGEPGVVFLGRYNRLSTGAGVERIISVNPCGEQGLGPYSVCNLGAINLDVYAQDGDFDWVQFNNDVCTAIRFLDNVIDKDRYYVPETAKQQKDLRRIGLSVMGLADAMVRLGIRYGSDESIDFTKRIFREMKDMAIETSMSLAEAKGPARAWKDSMWQRPYLKEYAKRNPDVDQKPLRNLFLLTQAPTGTTALFTGVNSGIEPYFAIETYRKDRTGERVVLAKAVADLGLDKTPDFVVTSQQVTVEEHIAVQAAAQKYVDSSVSKTINAPEWQTPEETAKAYQLAYDSGLKGLAYYRDKSRNIQVLHHAPTSDELAKAASPYMAARESRSEGAQCPDCGSDLVFTDGCKLCMSCGWSAC